MSHDIVARLRVEHRKFSEIPKNNSLMMPAESVVRLANLWNEAADEIERLCARVAELEKTMADDNADDDWLNKFCDPKLVWIDTKSKTIDIIDLPDGRGIYYPERPYFIRFDKLDSVCAFLWWLRHLAEKGWFTSMHVEQFSKCYEFLLRNEMIPQRIHGEQFEIDAEDLGADHEP